MTRSPARFLGPLIVGVSAVVMLAWVWEKSPDPVIDYGREVYIPWRITQGEVLYRDINFFNGPLSQYLHAGVFAVFGEGIRTLMIFNAIIATLTGALIYRIVLRLTDSITATTCGVLFFTLFAFAQQAGIPNYSWITAYSYDLPHAVSLSVLNLWLLARFVRTGSTRWLCATGFVLGLVLLTKAEVALADFVAIMIALAVHSIGQRRWGRVPLACVCAAVPVAIALSLLCIAMPARVAWDGLLGSWKFLGEASLLDLPFFRRLNGTDNVPASLLTIAIWSISLGLLALASIGIATVRKVFVTLLAAVVIGLALWWFWPKVNWADVVRASPVVLGIAGMIMLVRYRRAPSESALVAIACLLFAGAVAGKLLLNVNIARYGFALSMPATLAMVAIFVGALPGWCASRGWSAWGPRAVFLPVIAVTLYVHMLATNYWLSIKPVPVGEGADFFFADSRGAVVDQAVEILKGGTTEQDTLVCLPEGLLINYLTRRATQVAHLNFTPPALLMYGEGAILDDLKSHPPTFICLVHVDTSQDYGPRAFGIDYGQQIMEWIRLNYEPRATLGAVPYTSDRFGILILRKK